jgi:RNA polymerase sigma-70 factor (ECF subfamily)
LYANHTDEQLVALLNNSDESAFTEIYNRYWNKLFVVANHRLDGEAQEIVQEIFYNLWKRRKTLQLTHTLSTYLAAAVKFEVINRLAAQKRRQRYLQYSTGRPEPEQNFTQQQVDFDLLLEQLSTLVKALPDKCRLVYQLHREEGYSQKEIAAKLGIAYKTVEAHLSTALRKIRRGLTHLFSLAFQLF